MKEEREQVTYIMQMNFTSRDQLLQLLQYLWIKHIQVLVVIYTK